MRSIRRPFVGDLGREERMSESCLNVESILLLPSQKSFAKVVESLSCRISRSNDILFDAFREVSLNARDRDGGNECVRDSPVMTSCRLHTSCSASESKVEGN